MSVTKLSPAAPNFQMVSVDKLTIDPRVQRKEGIDLPLTLEGTDR